MTREEAAPYVPSWLTPRCAPECSPAGAASGRDRLTWALQGNPLHDTCNWPAQSISIGQLKAKYAK